MKDTYYSAGYLVNTQVVLAIIIITIYPDSLELEGVVKLSSPIFLF